MYLKCREGKIRAGKISTRVGKCKIRASNVA